MLPMSSEPASPTASDADLIVRPAQARELIRARQFFSLGAEQPPAPAQFLAALKQHPVERMVAVLAWWKENAAVRFLVACKPGLVAERAAEALIPKFEALPGVSGLALEYGRLIAAGEDVAPWLTRHGYQTRRTERIFESPCATVYERVEAFRARHGAEIPARWRTESIKSHSPDMVWPLIAPFGLIKLEALRNDWATPGARGYDPEYSNILFDSETPLGVLLVRVNPVCLTIDIRVVKPITARLRALANLSMFAHIQQVVTPTTWQVLAFRGDQIEHRETANLARRMGGQQVAVRHLYARPGTSLGGSIPGPESVV